MPDAAAQALIEAIGVVATLGLFAIGLAAVGAVLFSARPAQW